MKRYLVFALAMIIAFSSLLYAFAEEEPVTYTAISLGASGEDVREMQTRLKELGYYNKAIDGDYGNGTKSAVSSFQARNGLTADGIASEETLAAIFSEDAIPAPAKPAIELSNLYFTSTILHCDATNNTESTIDHIELKILPFDAGGKVYILDKTLTSDKPGLTGSYTYSRRAIRPHSTVDLAFDITDLHDYNTKYFGAYIVNYHTSDGNDYAYSPEQAYLYKSDNSVEYPTDESEPDCMADSVFDKANAVKLGLVNGSISPWTSSLYMLPEGVFVFSVDENGTLDQAGITAGDVLLAFDDTPILSGHSWEYARLKMLDGETVTVHYWRSNQEHTTLIALDMDSINPEPSVSEEAQPESDDIVAQLQQVADLYEKGLLTEEEYETAKSKILN